MSITVVQLTPIKSSPGVRSVLIYLCLLQVWSCVWKNKWVRTHPSGIEAIIGSKAKLMMKTIVRMIQWKWLLELNENFKNKTVKLGAQGIRINVVSIRVFDSHSKDITNRI